jgi:hypothetical protein
MTQIVIIILRHFLKVYEHYMYYKIGNLSCGLNSFNQVKTSLPTT